MEFYVYLSSATSDNVILPMMRHTESGYSTQLDKYDLSVMEDGVWTKGLIGLGRHLDAFQVKDVFISCGERDIYTGDQVEIAVITKDGIETIMFDLKAD